MIVLLHVDDFIIADNNVVEREKILKVLKAKYGIKELGEVKRYTNYEITRDRKAKKIFLHQHDFIAELLEFAGMKNCSASKSKMMTTLEYAKDNEPIMELCGDVPYRSLTGALIHLSIHSRPDIAFEVSTLCKFNSKPTQAHWVALKQLLRYLKYTANKALALGGTSNLVLHAFADSGFASDKDTGKSPGGYVFYWGDSLISHKSKWFKQLYNSSTETEIAALYMTVSMAVWLQKLADSFGISNDSPITINEDNQGAIKYCESNDRAGRMRHIDVKFHWIREKIADKTVQLAYVKSEDNVADIVTKTVKGVKLAQHMKSLGLMEMPSIA